MFKITFLSVFLIAAAAVSAQQLNPPVHKPENRSVLNSYEESANSLAAKNLNRFAIERLYKYNNALDSLYPLEKADTIKTIEQIYLKTTAAKQTQRKTAQEQIKSFSSEKAVLADEYHGLLRKAALAFGVWVSIILLMIEFRKRKMKSSELATGNSEIQLKSIEERNQLSDVLITEGKAIADQVSRTSSALGELQALATSHAADSSWPAEVTSSIDKLVVAANREERIVQALSELEAYQTEEKVKTNINNLCDTYMEIAQRGFATTFPELNCQVTRDFEKRLPEIPVASATVGNLLMNVLLNAFQSVEEKNRRNIKGYQPKISISTRILPRFLQIRVRDNGVGMTDEIQARAMEEFYSTKLPEVAVGLGLSESAQVISTLHKGELKIESEKENSTDVYIKFFL